MVWGGADTQESELERERKFNKTRQGGDATFRANKKARKGWPSPNLILDILRTGKSVNQTTKELNTSYYVIKKYIEEIPSFAVDYQKILDEQERLRIDENPGYGNLTEIKDLTAKEKFLYMFEKTLKREASREYAGLSASEIENYLDPASGTYDENFSNSFKDILIRRKWTIEDNLWDFAQKDKTIFRDLLRVAFPESFGNKESTNTTNNSIFIGVSSGAEKDALEFLTELFAENPKTLHVVDSKILPENAEE